MEEKGRVWIGAEVPFQGGLGGRKKRRQGMEGGEQSESVQQFCNMTTTMPEHAQFFLESCAWQLKTVIHSFFENNVGPTSASPQDSGEAWEEEEEEDDDDCEEFVLSRGAIASRTTTSIAKPAPAPAVAAGLGPGQTRWGTCLAGPTQGTRSFGAASRGSKPKSNKDKGTARLNGGRGGITTMSDLNKHPNLDSNSDGP